MKIEITRDQLWDKLSHWSTNEVIEYFEEHGLELIKPLPPVERGIFRREEGIDLIHHDGFGNWTTVAYGYDVSTDRITWALDHYRPDWWVQVLASLHEPINFSAQRVAFNSEGTRVA